MKAPWNIFVLFCEDIREEKSGQHSLVGILPDNLSVPHLPGVIPKLGVYARCHVDPEADVGSISLKLRFPDGEETAFGSFGAEKVKEVQSESKAKGTPFAGFIMVTVLGMLKLPKPGRVLGIVSIGGKDIVAGAVNFLTSSDENG
jgi:hypothetical protein